MIEIKLTNKELKMLKYILIFTGADPLTAENLTDLLKEPVSDKDIHKLLKNLNNNLKTLKGMGY